MPETEDVKKAEAEELKSSAANEPKLDEGAYEIIRNRLRVQGDELRSRMDRLNAARKETFGSIDLKLLNTERVSTANNCIPRDMIAVGEVFIFGYNVHLGLRTETRLDDVFAIYSYDGSSFRDAGLELIADERFEKDFREFYTYYKKAHFAKFAMMGPHLHMVFHVGDTIAGLKTFKWVVGEDGKLTYVDNRSDHEFRFPPQHEFEWIRCTRDMHRYGAHPHVSIDDRVFVETVGGDLTVKIEDNTDDGDGIYAEPVDDPDQTLDDAEIYYAAVGNLILLKIRPYQEKDFRYIVYSEKVQQARRIDAIENACVLLPEDHGIIFSNGYYLQTGEYKKFEINMGGMIFERHTPSPNGEDYLYVFYNRISGTYVLLSYNLIEQGVDTPITCAGYSLFENGQLVYFKTPPEPQKYHAVQIWQTPYVGPNFEIPTQANNYIYKIGNRDIVRCMAACQAVLNLIAREDTYANLYLDIVRMTTDVADTYFWLDSEESFNLKTPVLGIRDAASGAIEEFEKVVRMKKNATDGLRDVTQKTDEIINTIRASRFESIDKFVKSLGGLRAVRGELISLKDVRYMDVTAVEKLEEQVGGQTEDLSQRCVEFLLDPDALTPYRERANAQGESIDGLQKATEAKELGEQIKQTGNELEMLIDIVSNLKIEDATQRTAIIDNISGIYSELNQVRSRLRNKSQELAAAEGVSEFASQMKLLNQAVINYLDVCDTPEKADEYLGKLMIQLEELEGKFADFDEFVEQLAEKRQEIYTAFESRKVQLQETRNRKADSLMRSAQRILKGIRTRAESFDNVNDINGYFAGDLMIDKVRDIIQKLNGLGDSVKADDIQGQLKTVREDVVRQLKDRQELFVGGENVIKFGNHHFSVNTQKLDLTTVLRDGEMYLHLTGTDFFEKISNEEFLATREVWSQDIVSENREVYRGCYLAYRLLCDLREADAKPSAAEALAMSEEELQSYVQQYMGPRYAEGYVKGVHDFDGAKLLRALLEMDARIGLLRYHTRARALAETFWYLYGDDNRKKLLSAKLRGFGSARKVFPKQSRQPQYVAELRELLETFVDESALFDPAFIDEAAEYLFATLSREKPSPIAPEAAALHKMFTEHVEKFGATGSFSSALSGLDRDGRARFSLIRDWVAAFAGENDDASSGYVDETSALIATGAFDGKRVSAESVSREVTGLVGNHSALEKGAYNINFNDFSLQLSRFCQENIPRFNSFQEMKKSLLDRARAEMRLDEFKPRVLTSFVRNQLLDKVYLPLVGDNLAKQVGVVGENKRTDSMGLLLLVSPPGYGKTTLMEYIANRLGIIFMKINGPAIGHKVTSLDPSEANNAAAREELEKLNLALEMGDNIMIYLDDIQHTNPELLQKFISLCDATRKIEGVYKGRTRTYDLRGKKVAVVMAGNPYTESGGKFQIPDMLSNRADTYNLGDIIGDNADSFKLSYLENALTSNPVLNKLATRSKKDIHGIIRIAETGSRDGVELEGNYTNEEIGELTGVMKKLLRVRDVILTVNLEYIRSAAMQDEFRTEPAFKLQGSYRNMNRIAEKILPIMNDGELETLIASHYENEAQTLTTGAEANLLKFKEMIGTATPEEAARWEEIKKTFKRNQIFRGVGGEDRLGQVVVQLGTFTEGLNDIRDAITDGISAMADNVRDVEAKEVNETVIAEETIRKIGEMLQGLKPKDERKREGAVEARLSPETVSAIGKMLEKIKPQVATSHTPAAPVAGQPAPHAGGMQLPAGMIPKIEVVNKVPRGMLHVLREQFELMQTWLSPAPKGVEHESAQLETLRTQIDAALLSYENLIRTIERGNTSRKTNRRRDYPDDDGCDGDIKE